MRGQANLALVPDGAEAVEELKGRNDVALDEYAQNDCDGGPPASANRQLVEPLLERKLSHHALAGPKHSGHGGGSCRRGGR